MSYNFYKWRDSRRLERIVDELRARDRREAGRNETPSAVAIDSQSAKTTENR